MWHRALKVVVQPPENRGALLTNGLIAEVEKTGLAPARRMD